MSDTSPAMIEIFEDPFTGNNEFDRRTVFTFFSENEIRMVGVDETGIIHFQTIGLDEFMGLFQGRQDDADMVQAHGMPCFVELPFFRAEILNERIFAAAGDRCCRLNIFNEDTLVGCRAAEVDDNVVRTLDSFLF